MKKLLLSILILTGIAFNSCKKEFTTSSTASRNNKEVSTPTASFTVTARDAAGALVTLEDGAAISGRTVTIRYTGTPTDYKAVFTGDASSIYIADTARLPTGVTSAQSGRAFAADTLRHTYTAAGTYPITVVSSNIGDKGRVISRSVATKTITLR